VKRDYGSILDIGRFTKNVMEKNFLSDKEKQNAVIGSIEVIGEAVKNLPLDFTSEHKEIPWEKIAGMRNKIILGDALKAVWKVVEESIPVLKKQIKKILREEKSDLR